jgi:hypothetical protein
MLKRESIIDETGSSRIWSETSVSDLSDVCKYSSCVHSNETWSQYEEKCFIHPKMCRLKWMHSAEAVIMYLIGLVSFRPNRQFSRLLKCSHNPRVPIWRPILNFSEVLRLPTNCTNMRCCTRFSHEILCHGYGSICSVTIDKVTCKYADLTLGQHETVISSVWLLALVRLWHVSRFWRRDATLCFVVYSHPTWLIRTVFQVISNITRIFLAHLRYTSTVANELWTLHYSSVK